MINSVNPSQVNAAYALENNQKTAHNCTVDCKCDTSKLERTPVQDTVEFTGKKELETKDLNNGEKSASLGKKIAVGVASSIVPGLGQAINGQWGKAAGLFLGETALSIGAGLAIVMAPAAVGVALGAATLGVGIYSIVDAVKNAKA